MVCAVFDDGEVLAEVVPGSAAVADPGCEEVVLVGLDLEEFFHGFGLDGLLLPVL